MEKIIGTIITECALGVILLEDGNYKFSLPGDAPWEGETRIESAVRAFEETGLKAVLIKELFETSDNGANYKVIAAKAEGNLNFINERTFRTAKGRMGAFFSFESLGKPSYARHEKYVYKLLGIYKKDYRDKIKDEYFSKIKFY